MIYSRPNSLQAANTLARESLYGFALVMMAEARGIRWERAPHHKVIFKALERVFKGECTRLIINIPPRYSKTESVLMFVTWTLGHVPDSEYIFTSYSGRLAATNSWRARELVKHESYQRVFPKTIIDDSSTARDEWRTTAGGCIYAVGAGGSITGYGAGKMRNGFGGAIVIDDALKADDARSDVMRSNVLEWFPTTLQSRVNSPQTPIIVISQRLHEEDLAGWLMDGGNGEKWESIIFPAITESGEALWPEKHTIDDLRRMERASPYVFAGQYLQRPAPLAGGIFKPDNLIYLDHYPTINNKVRGWDLAGTHEDGDWTVGVLIGKTQQGRYVILDVRFLQGSPDEVEAVICATAKMDGFGTKIGLPQDPGQAGKAQLLYLTKALAGYRVVASPESGDKITRAEPFASQVNVGNVDIVRNAEWNNQMISQMRNFPNAAHDDFIDAMSRAAMTIMEKSGMTITSGILASAAARGPMRIGMRR